MTTSCLQVKGSGNYRDTNLSSLCSRWSSESLEWDLLQLIETERHPLCLSSTHHAWHCSSDTVIERPPVSLTGPCAVWCLSTQKITLQVNKISLGYWDISAYMHVHGWAIISTWNTTVRHYTSHADQDEIGCCENKTNVQSWRSSLRPRNSVTCTSWAPEVSPIIVSPVSCPRKSCYFTNTNMAVASDGKEKVWPYWQLELRENYISTMGFCECWTRPDLCDCWCSLSHHALILQCSLLRQTTTFSSWKMIFTIEKHHVWFMVQFKPYEKNNTIHISSKIRWWASRRGVTLSLYLRPSHSLIPGLCLSHFLISSILQRTATISSSVWQTSAEYGQITLLSRGGERSSNNFHLRPGSPALTMKLVCQVIRFHSFLSDLPDPLNNCYSRVWLFPLLFWIHASHFSALWWL